MLDGQMKEISKVVSVPVENSDVMFELVNKIENQLLMSKEDNDIKLAALGKILEKYLNGTGGK